MLSSYSNHQKKRSRLNKMVDQVYKSLVVEELSCKATAPVTGTWTTTNVVTDRSIDANGALTVIGDGLCTLIEDLKSKGIIE